MQEKFNTIEEFLGEDTPDVETPDTENVETTVEEKPEEQPKEQSEENPEDKETKKEEDASKKTTKHNPMKELRDKANAATKAQEKIDGALNRYTDGDYEFKLKDFKNENGKIDYDAFIKAMDEADVKRRAESRGLSPEMQAEIERYEREKKEVEIAKARVQMDRQLNNFQMEQQLSPEELNVFIADSMKIGINPLSIAALDKTSKGTLALKMLYKAVYAERLTQEAIKKAIEDHEAKRIADAEAKRTQPKSNPAGSHTKKTEQTDEKGMALEDFLNTL